MGVHAGLALDASALQPVAVARSILAGRAIEAVTGILVGLSLSVFARTALDTVRGEMQNEIHYLLK